MGEEGKCFNEGKYSAQSKENKREVIKKLKKKNKTCGKPIA